MTEQMLVRQWDLIPQSILKSRIGIIGAGAVGSFTALTLAKMGFSDIEVFDFDQVSEENINCQFYRPQDIGFRKVDSLKEIVRDFSGAIIKSVPERFEAGRLGYDAVVMAVDSMASRRAIFDAIVADENKFCTPKIVIDPRMASHHILIHSFKPILGWEAERYKATLFTDAEAHPERCTAKATMFSATVISGYVSKFVSEALNFQDIPNRTEICLKTNAMTID